MAATLESEARVLNFITRAQVEGFLAENPQAESLARKVRAFIGETLEALPLATEAHADPEYRRAARMLAAALRAA